MAVRRLTPISFATTSARSPELILSTNRARSVGVSLAFLGTFTGPSSSEFEGFSTSSVPVGVR